MAGSTVLVFFLSTITNMLTVFDKSAASYLPAESTLAVLHHPTAEDLEMFASWFPELSTGPGAESADAIALLTLSGPEHIPVFFVREQGREPENKASVSLGAYRVTSPSEKVLQELAAGTTAPLSEDTAYKELSSGRERSSSWLFARRQLLPETDKLPQQILEALLFQKGEALAIAQTEDGTRSITLYGEQSTLEEGTVLPAPILENDILSFNLREGQHIWQQAFGGLQRENQDILSGTLEHLLWSGFGDTVSMKYDILPLMEHHIAVRLTQNNSGGLLVLVRGETQDEKLLAMVTERLHEGIRLYLPKTKVTNYTFSNLFSTQNIHSDHSALYEELYMQDEWQIRSMQEVESTTGLFTAVKRGAFIIANTKDGLLSALDKGQPDHATPLSDQGMLVSTRQGGGWVNKVAFVSLFTEHLSSLAGEVDLPPLKNLPSILLWSMERRGPLTTITFKSA